MQHNDLPVEHSRSLLHRANQAFFFVGGFGTASWAPLVPLLKARLGVAEDVLGLLLLCIGVGSLLTMPIAGFLAGRFGCRRVLAVDSLVFAALLLSLAAVGDICLAVPALLAFGAAMGILDVTVNIHAVRVEQLLKKRVYRRLAILACLWDLPPSALSHTARACWRPLRCLLFCSFSSFSSDCMYFARWRKAFVFVCFYRRRRGSYAPSLCAMFFDAREEGFAVAFAFPFADALDM